MTNLPKVGSIVQATYKPKFRSFRIGQPKGRVVAANRSFIRVVDRAGKQHLCLARIYDFEALVHVDKEDK